MESPATVYSDKLYQVASRGHIVSSGGPHQGPFVEFVRAHPKGAVRFRPFEEGLDNVSRRCIEEFQIYPFGSIEEFCRHIPYASGKKDFFEKTGRESFEVFQYVFKVPGDDKEYHVMWDYNVGLVRMTPFFKCCKYSKTTPAKMLNLNPGLRDITHSITGGSIMAQGYWMPYSCAKAVCATFCYHIAGALIPVFGPEFPSECLPPHSSDFARMVIDPALVAEATRETETMRQAIMRGLEDCTAPTPSFHRSQMEQPIGDFRESYRQSDVLSRPSITLPTLFRPDEPEHNRYSHCPRNGQNYTTSHDYQRTHHQLPSLRDYEDDMVVMAAEHSRHTQSRRPQWDSSPSPVPVPVTPDHYAHPVSKVEDTQSSVPRISSVSHAPPVSSHGIEHRSGTVDNGYEDNSQSRFASSYCYPSPPRRQHSHLHYPAETERGEPSGPAPADTKDDVNHTTTLKATKKIAEIAGAHRYAQQKTTIKRRKLKVTSGPVGTSPSSSAWNATDVDAAEVLVNFSVKMKASDDEDERRFCVMMKRHVVATSVAGLE
ncbi:hypothetical protein Sste5346_001723 [Sporothrix stenoceras]|uniref:HTH APSES-type domain-containing protein n=1 Tax=Sporothrix stenoceras TaxID=5173 RepID=A0ABR3ZNA3_9PEZI